MALPLPHPLGEAQVDFGETTFYEKDIKYEGYHLAMTFPHSDAKYVQLFKGQNFECLARGLMDIFEHVGGVPGVIRFDNMSTAVKSIKTHGEREKLGQVWGNRTAFNISRLRNCFYGMGLG